jgi:hypothetical protein
VLAVVAGQEEVPLGLEEAEQVRLGDAGLARDGLRRGSVVAPEREVLDGDLHDLGPALLGRLARAGRCGHRPP